MRIHYKKYWKRYPQRYSKEVPGERLQMDVKFLEKLGNGGKRYYQFIAIDDCTRFHILRIYDSNTVKNTIEFVDEVQKALPFVIGQRRRGEDSQTPVMQTTLRTELPLRSCLEAAPKACTRLV